MDEVVSYEACVGTQPLTCDDVRWTVPATQNWFTFTATPGVLHLVTVRAVNDYGFGPFAHEIGVSIPRMSPIADRSDGVGVPVTVDPMVTDPDGSGHAFLGRRPPARTHARCRQRPHQRRPSRGRDLSVDRHGIR